MIDRFLYVTFQIDANRINASGRLADMNQLERWHRDGVIRLIMSEPAHDEASVGGGRRRDKANTLIYSISNPEDHSPRESAM